jgi:formylmethanofuran dehydrogenase subunit E
MKIDAAYEEVVTFHGHSCPGLAIGYRMAKAAIKALEVSRSKDEELVAIVENDACGVDAVQYLLGSTFGKGNLIYRDYGKHIYTIIRRDTGKAVRISADFAGIPEPEGIDIHAIRQKVQAKTATNEELTAWNKHKAAKTAQVLNTPAEKFLSIQFVEPEMPPKARIFESIKCASCGEKVASGKMVEVDGAKLCKPCANID